MRSLYCIIFSWIFVFTGSHVLGQTYTMTNGSVTTCSGTFTDDNQGANGNYSNNQNTTFTICPSTPGAKVVVTFTSFNLQANFDYLTVYDGANTSALTLGNAQNSGNTIIGPYTASPSNASGCLTFVFSSNGSTTASGWTATISCYVPCPTISSGIASTTPAAVNGYIKRCPNQPITFNATAATGGAAPYTYLEHGEWHGLNRTNG